MSCLEIIDAFAPYYDGRAPPGRSSPVLMPNRPAPAPRRWRAALPGNEVAFVPDMNDVVVRRRKPAVTGKGD